MWSQSTNVTDGQIDDMRSQCTKVHRAVKMWVWHLEYLSTCYFFVICFYAVSFTCNLLSCKFIQLNRYIRLAIIMKTRKPRWRARQPYVYEDLFWPSHRCLTPPSWGTLCDINAVYASLKNTFNGLQFRCWQYGSIFIRLAIASETCEMSRNCKSIWLYSSSRSSKIVDLGVSGKPIRDCHSHYCNFSRICNRFRDIYA